MDEILHVIPAEALPVVEKYLRRLLAQIEKQTDRRTMAEVWLTQRQEQEHARAIAVAKAVKAMREDGVSFDKALKMLGMIPALGNFHLRRGLAAAEAEDRRQRNLEIARLSGERVSQAEIARRLKCSPALVRKVLKGGKP